MAAVPVKTANDTWEANIGETGGNPAPSTEAAVSVTGALV
jgi:hypothetical protein